MLGVERAVGAQAGGHAHRFAQAIDHAGFAVLHARHHHVIAVGAHVDGSDQFAVLDLDLIALAHAWLIPGCEVRILSRGNRGE